jgi:hypothetical protein
VLFQLASNFAANRPASLWLDRKSILNPDAVTPKDYLHREYCRDCADAGHPVIGKTALGRAMKKLRPAVTDYQRTVNGVVTWCYFGTSILVSDLSVQTRRVAASPS